MHSANYRRSCQVKNQRIKLSLRLAQQTYSRAIMTLVYMFVLCMYNFNF